MSVMDFDLSKENIQPLRGGRNATQLDLALQAQTNPEIQQELQHQRQEFENSIKNYIGNDPLENWYHYISWIEQSYPKLGHEGNLVPLLEACLQKFENDKRYTNDRRFCKLWIKYIDGQKNPLELYHMMHARGLCLGCADFYKAWAYYHEAAGDYQGAYKIFEIGKHELAQPYDELMAAYNNLYIAAGQHLIHGPDENGLKERRQALTSLLTFKPGRVANVRHPIATTSAVILPNVNQTTSRSNVAISAYEDKGEEIGNDAAGPVSILTAAKRQDVSKENLSKPGPWTSAPDKKRIAVQRSTPKFIVHEDNNESYNKLPKFPTCSLENFANWKISLTIPEPKDDKYIPMYPKHRVYSNNTEYSLEELRANFIVKNGSRRQKTNVVETHQIVQSILNNLEQDTNSKDDVLNEQPFCKKTEQPMENFSSLAAFNNIPRQSTSATTTHQLTNIWNQGLPPQIFVTSPPNSQPNETALASNNTLFDVWNSPNEKSPIPVPRQNTASKFTIYEQSNVSLRQHIEPKGNAMKTPFKDLNADELAETGSRGGMDIAAAAPVDSAKRLSIFDEDSCDNYLDGEDTNLSFTTNTQIFNFNLNAMKVSTPHTKQEIFDTESITNSEECNLSNNAKTTRKQLFGEANKFDHHLQMQQDNQRHYYQQDKTDTKQEVGNEKVLSVILEETKSYGSSSSSSGGTTTKSSIHNNQTKPNNNMSIISEEHNSYLAQNMMANDALRRTLLGNIMDFDLQQCPSPIRTRTTSPPKTMITDCIVNSHTTPLSYIPSDPFKPSIINELLHRIGFPGPHTKNYYVLNSLPKIIVRKDICIGSDKYSIEKQLGKGNFGIVFRGTDLKTGNTVALKTQKESNKWEFYICRELQMRLADHPLKSCFMDVRIGYFSDQGSIFISDFGRWGSLLDLANAVRRQQGKTMKEALCIYFCLEMLKVVQAMHDVKIIHADIKPDNFLVQLAPDSTISLQLIDFGCSIDMTLFPSDACFTRRVTTENFVCCEMRDGRPWNYHTDMFCIAATAHVLLFDKYIDIQKNDGHWSITSRLPRYLRTDVWNMFFSSLLNQQSGPADSNELQKMLHESLKYKWDEYCSESRLLLNILKNR